MGFGIDKVIYYKDELNDDFEIPNTKPITIDGKYKYLHKSVFWNACSFFVHKIVATPLVYVFMKHRFNIEFKNDEILKSYRDTGFFMYSNHTQLLGDAFIPSLLNVKKKPYVVVNSSNVSQPIVGHVIKLLGPLPLPDDMEAARNFSAAMDEIIVKKKCPIIIYPEAHIWRYYTKIRPFKDTSFKYPLKYNVPTFSSTVTYRKRENKVPQIIVYIDGPFYPDEGIPKSERRKNLRDKVYKKMVERAETSNVEFIKYIKEKENV